MTYFPINISLIIKSLSCILGQTIDIDCSLYILVNATVEDTIKEIKDNNPTVMRPTALLGWFRAFFNSINTYRPLSSYKGPMWFMGIKRKGGCLSKRTMVLLDTEEMQLVRLQFLQAMQNIFS